MSRSVPISVPVSGLSATWTTPALNELIEAAAPLRVGAHEVLVAHPLTVLRRLEQLERRKDRARADEIERVRADVSTRRSPLIGLDRLLGEYAPHDVDGPSEFHSDADEGNDGQGEG